MLERLGHDGEDKEAMRHRWMMNGGGLGTGCEL